jgi:5-methylcytosine-specific restriction endonuclease McrA
MAKGIGSYIKKKDEEIVRNYSICLYCGSDKDLMIDHITPVSKGGNSDLNNLTRCCNSCNSSKSDRPLDEFKKHIENKLRIAEIEVIRYRNILESIRTGSYKIG